MKVIRDPVPTSNAEVIPDAKDVARYLDTGEVVMGAAIQVFDELDPEAPPIGGALWLTDGEWVWPSQLAYYVRTYSTAPPQELLDHIRRLDYTIPTVASELVAQACEALVGSYGKPIANLSPSSEGEDHQAGPFG